MEICLLIDVHPDNTFKVMRWWYGPEIAAKESILTLDYKYTPWPRYAGNLLWP